MSIELQSCRLGNTDAASALVDRQVRSALGANVAKDRWLAIQVNRVLLPIFARGLLSKRQAQIAWAVISDSWAHYRKGADPAEFNWTRDPMPVARIAKITGMALPHVLTELNAMMRSGTIVQSSSLLDRKLRLSFNEHFKHWGYQNGNPQVTKTVTLPKRSRYQNGKQRLPNRSPELTESVTSHIISPLSPSTKSVSTRKKRAPTDVEKRFIDGFRNRYGHDPEIVKKSAIALAQKVSKYGQQLVIDKIESWWDSPAGAWVAGNRSVGAFLHSFDDIVVGGNGQRKKQPDLSRFDRVSRPTRP